MRNTAQYEISDKPLFFVFLCTLMGGALVGSLAVASKLVTIFGLTASATFLGYALTFTATDVTSELFGKKAANRVVFAGFITTLFGLAIFLIAMRLPPAGFWQNQEAFVSVFGTTWKIALGGLTAYLCSQFLDVWIFHRLRESSKGRNLWLRNNVSTATSQLIDTTIFITIAFGFNPTLIIGQYLLKLIVAIVDTPIVYLVVQLGHMGNKRP